MTIRRRIGLLVPSTNSTGEPDFHIAVPKGVSVHSHHLWIESNISVPATMAGMNSELAQGARYLAPLGIEVICMAGTTNSFYNGLQGSTWMEEEMSKAAGVPAVASSPSIAKALGYLGAKRISVATPYPKWNNDRLKDYFTSAGFEVLNVESDPKIADGHAQHMNDQDPSEIADFATSICRDGADAVFCSCSGWRALEAASEIERRTGKPVVTTNQATIWRVLRTIGIKEARPGFGRLLAEMPPVD
jgi:maleate cis-trans isomerase